jgi:hypothetical protein
MKRHVIAMLMSAAAATVAEMIINRLLCIGRGCQAMGGEGLLWPLFLAMTYYFIAGPRAEKLNRMEENRRAIMRRIRRRKHRYTMPPEHVNCRCTLKIAED